MKNVAALAALSIAAVAPGAARAQGQPPSSVQIYGIVDTAVEVLTNTGPGARLARLTGLTGSVPSRIGFRGREDLGDGLFAFFTLEGGIAVDNGTVQQGARAYGRQSLVGVGGPWGQLSFGRHQNMTFWSVLDADVIGPTLYSLASIDPYIANARSDNSVLYRGTFGGLTVGATYSLGRDTSAVGGPAATNCAGESATDTSACRQFTAMLKYDTPVWGAALAHDRMNGGTGAAFGLANSGLADTRTTINAYYRFIGVKVGGGLYRRHNEGNPATPRSELAFVGVSYTVDPRITLDAQVLHLDVKNSGNDATLMSTKATYAFSRRTAVYLLAGHIDNRGASRIALSPGTGETLPPVGGAQTGLAAGIRHAF
jgi:predicted porin